MGLKGWPRLYESAILLAVLSGPPRFRERSVEASLTGEIDTVVLLNLSIWCAAGLWMLCRMIGATVLLKRPVRFGQEEKIALLFCGLVILTVLVSPSKLLTAFRSMQICVMVLFSHFWVKTYGIRQTLKHVLITCVLLELGIVISAIFAPNLVFVGDRLRGDQIADTGWIAAVGIVIGVGMPTIVHRHLRWPLLLFLGSMVALSRTRSAFIGCLVFFLMILTLMPSKRRLVQLMVLTLLVIPVAITYELLSPTYLFLVREEASIPSMSGRIPLWGNITTFMLSHAPWTGVGFGAERIVSLLFGFGSPHSAYMSVLCGTGLVGVALYLILILSLGAACFRLLGRVQERGSVVTVMGLLISAALMGTISDGILYATTVSVVFWFLPSLVNGLREGTAGQKELLLIEESVGF